MNVLKDEKSKILPRREILVMINHAENSTPSKEKLKENFVKKFKGDKSLIVIKKVNSSFGEPNSKVELLIYEDKGSMESIERIKENKEPTKIGPKVVEEKKENIMKESKTTEEKVEKESTIQGVGEKQDGKETKTKEQTTK